MRNERRRAKVVRITEQPTINVVLQQPTRKRAWVRFGFAVGVAATVTLQLVVLYFTT